MYNPFIKQNHEYTRDINILSSYVVNSKPITYLRWVVEIITYYKWVLDKVRNDEKFKLKDPTVYYLVAFTIPTDFWIQGLCSLFLYADGICSATHDIAADGYYMLETRIRMPKRSLWEFAVRFTE